MPRLEEAHPDLALVAVYQWEDFDSGDSCQNTQTLKGREVRAKIVMHRREMARSTHQWEREMAREIGSTRKMDAARATSILSDILGYCEDFRCLYSLKEWKQKKEREERERVEGLAAEIAQRHKVSATDPEFLDACIKELERQRDFRYGLQEDGLCATGYGIASPSAAYEQWNEMMSDSQSADATVHRIMDYYRKWLPLTYARWSETRRDKGDYDGQP